MTEQVKFALSKKRKKEAEVVDKIFCIAPTTPAKKFVPQPEFTPEGAKPSFILDEVVATPLGENWYDTSNESALSNTSTVDDTSLETPFIDKKHDVRNIHCGVVSNLNYGVVAHKKKSSGDRQKKKSSDKN